MGHAAATVTVIIPTYNRAHLVGQTINSMLRQTRPPDEIIVVDDGSTDETDGIVRAFGRRVRYIKQENAGKATALNRALAEVSTDYVWQMDDDDVALPDALQTHLDFLATHTAIDFSYGAHYNFRGNEPPKPEWLHSQRPMQIATAAPEDLFVRAMLWFPFYLQSMLVPQRCYERVGPFDESLPFCEDYDMILRLARHFRGANINAPVFCVRVHSGLRGPAHERHSASERGATFRSYERRLFMRLRTELRLADYLSRGLPPDELTEIEKRRAQLQRACIMSRHGLFSLAYEDLNEALDHDETPLRDGDRRILAQMLKTEGWWLRSYPGCAKALGRLLRRRHADEALDACATGLGWQLATSVRRRQYDEAACIAANLRRLLGTARLATFVARASVRRYQSQRAA